MQFLQPIYYKFELNMLVMPVVHPIMCIVHRVHRPLINGHLMVSANGQIWPCCNTCPQ